MGKRFVYGTNPSVPDYMFVPSTGHTFKFVTDHLGSPVEIIDVNTGAVAEEIHYDDFGNVTSDSNPGFQPFGFAGCLYDIETKLCQFGARQYDASTGRWLSKDPILFDGGDTNLYGYVIQDPINKIDSSGTGPVVAGGVLAACFAMDAYGYYAALDGLKNLSKQISDLKKQNAALQKRLDGAGGNCENNNMDNENIYLQILANNNTLLELGKSYAKANGAVTASSVGMSAACLAAAAAGLAVGP